jgi:hypothetical protein
MAIQQSISSHTTGHIVTAGFVISNAVLAGIAPVASLIVTILAGLYYLETLYQSKTFQKFLAERRAKKHHKHEV